MLLISYLCDAVTFLWFFRSLNSEMLMIVHLRDAVAS